MTASTWGGIEDSGARLVDALAEEREGEVASMEIIDWPRIGCAALHRHIITAVSPKQSKNQK